MISRVDPNTPVIVGVGQFLNRDDEDPLDPLSLAAVGVISWVAIAMAVRKGGRA